MSTLYQRRTEQEWQLLLLSAGRNPELLRDCARIAEGEETSFRFQLLQSPSLVEHAGSLQVQDSHRIVISFPRFFPTIPLEVRLLTPVFHPNVHPDTGFICLWNRFSPADTVFEAVAQLQRVISWSLFNEELEHIMQPQSLEWYRDPTRSVSLPLLFETIRRPEGFDFSRTYAQPCAGGRRRLE